MTRRLRVLHAIHDFLPRHQAGSEIYAQDLCRALAAHCHVTVLAAEHDLGRPHGHVTWRVWQGLPVAEIVNNWSCADFRDTYESPHVTRRLAEILDMVQPHVLHVHSLLNLSFALPALARSRGTRVVATVHDYSLVCPSGGQRLHRADRHVCHEIDPNRCARCFQESPFHLQTSLARVAAASAAPRLVGSLASSFRRMAPRTMRTLARAARLAPGHLVTPVDIQARLARARELFDLFDEVVAPSASLARELERLGLPSSRLRVSDYGFRPLPAAPRRPHPGKVRFGFIGTLVWHKGAHVLVDAARQLPSAGWSLDIHGDLAVFPDYTADLCARAAGLPVRFRGPFTRNDVGQVLAGLDALVVPSIWLENSPLVIHEAFMAGVPVIAARMGGIPDLVHDGENGLLYDAADVSDLARVLRHAIDHPDSLAALASRAPAVKAIDDDAREWLARYEALASRPATAPGTPA